MVNQNFIVFTEDERFTEVLVYLVPERKFVLSYFDY